MRLRQKGDLGDDGVGDVAEPHQQCGLAAQRFQPTEKIGIGIEFVLRLMAALAEARRRHEDHRHRQIDAGDRDAPNRVARLSGRQKAPGLGAGDVAKAELDGRGRTGHAVDHRVAVVANLAAGRLNDGFDQGAGIDVVNAHHRFAILRRHEAALDGEGRNAGQDISAGRRRIDDGVLHADLGEQIVDLRPGMRGG